MPTAIPLETIHPTDYKPLATVYFDNDDHVLPGVEGSPGERLGDGVEILSDVLYWLLAWFLVSLPVALVFAQLLKANSEQLQPEEAGRRLVIRWSGDHGPAHLGRVGGRRTEP